jgi:5'-nucleotidase
MIAFRHPEPMPMLTRFVSLRLAIIPAFVALLGTLAVGCQSREFNISNAQEEVPSESREERSDEALGCARYLARGAMPRVVQGGRVRLAIVGLNDIHGHVRESEVILTDGTRTRSTLVGGLDAAAAYFQRMCEVYSGRVLFVDAGDSYLGTLVANVTRGRVVVDALDALGIHAATFGNHEFSSGQEFLRGVLRGPRSFHYISSNVRTTRGAFPPFDDEVFDRFSPGRVFDIGGIRVGVVSFTTLTTPAKILPSHSKGVSFLDPLSATNSEPEGLLVTAAARLRAEGADYVLLLAHAGGSCDMRRPPDEGDVACGRENDEVAPLLESLPQGTIDGVVSGHSHRPQRHFVRGVPVVQTTGMGKSASLLEVELEVPQPGGLASKPARVARQTPRDPVFFCHEHFEGYPSCNPQEPDWSGPFGEGVLDSRRPSRPPQAWGEPVNFDGAVARRVRDRLAPHFKRAEAQGNEVVGRLEVALAHSKSAESALGNCFTDAVLAGTRDLGVDLVVFNSGGLRGGLAAGELLYRAVFDALPFDSELVLVVLSGADLIRFAREVEATPDELPYFSAPFGARLRRLAESPRIHSVLKAGTPIDAEASYTVAVSDFQLAALDRLFGHQGHAIRATPSGKVLRDVFIQGFRRAKPASCSAATLGRHQFID